MVRIQVTRSSARRDSSTGIDTRTPSGRTLPF